MLRLGVSRSLLIGLILLLLRSRLLPCVLLLLIVGDGARGPYNHGSGGRGTHHRSSSSHLILLVFRLARHLLHMEAALERGAEK